MRHSGWFGGLAAGTLFALASASAQASFVPATIIGVFGGVVTNGNVLHSPDIFGTTNFNNAGTAVFAISNGTNPATTGNPPIQSAGSDDAEEVDRQAAIA